MRYEIPLPLAVEKLSNWTNKSKTNLRKDFGTQLTRRLIQAIHDAGVSPDITITQETMHNIGSLTIGELRRGTNAKGEVIIHPLARRTESVYTKLAATFLPEINSTIFNIKEKRKKR